jgi:hypothetical protein
MALCLGHKFRAVDASGNPLVAGLVYTYSPGTTNDKTTYSTRAVPQSGGTANANPVVLDAAGEADIYLDGPTKLVVKTSAGVTIDTVDSVDGIPANGDSPTFTDLTVSDDLVVGDDMTISGDINSAGNITASAVTLSGQLTSGGGFSLGATVSHDYGGGTAAWTLSAAEELATMFLVTNSSGPTIMNVAATQNKIYIVSNNTASNLTVKRSGGTGVVIATLRSAILAGNVADIYRITADAPFA